MSLPSVVDAAACTAATEPARTAGIADASAPVPIPARISVCIATYRRPQRLRALLDDLVLQQRLPDELIVVDNDPDGSARAIVEQCCRDGAPFPIRYEIQPVKNIAITRNLTVLLASGDWLAFIDDDERASLFWLANLEQATQLHECDGVLGPVLPVVPDHAPAWIRRGRFYDWARMSTGTVIPRNRLRFGNVLLRAALLRGGPASPHGSGPFDPDYGLTGGEDGELLTRLVQNNARLVWCDEAIVLEPVESARLSLRWLLLRALRGGQDFARHSLAGRYGAVTPWSRALLFARASVQMLIATTLLPLCAPFGRHHAARWLATAAANLGKLSVFVRLHYREYA